MQFKGEPVLKILNPITGPPPLPQSARKKNPILFNLMLSHSTSHVGHTDIEDYDCINKSWLKDVTRWVGLGGPRRIRKPRRNFFMFNGHENFEKNKDVGGLFLFSLGVGTVCSLHFSYFYSSSLLFPWVFRGLWLAQYFILKCLARIFAGVMPFQNIHPIRSFIACTIVQCANFYLEYSVVRSCA